MVLKSWKIFHLTKKPRFLPKPCLSLKICKDVDIIWHQLASRHCTESPMRPKHLRRIHWDYTSKAIILPNQTSTYSIRTTHHGFRRVHTPFLLWSMAPIFPCRPTALWTRANRISISIWREYYQNRLCRSHDTDTLKVIPWSILSPWPYIRLTINFTNPRRSRQQTSSIHSSTLSTG